MTFKGNSRNIRVVLFAVVLVSAAVAGYHWGTIVEGTTSQISNHDVLIGAAFFSGVTMLGAFWMESLVTQTEALAERAEEASKEHIETANMHREHVRELERIVGTLSDKNAELGNRLLDGEVRDGSEGSVNKNCRFFSSGRALNVSGLG